MKKQFLFATVIICFGLLFLADSDALAQCAMCRANVKSNLQGGNGGVGRNLNNAILYLMAVPYILISIVGYVFFKEKVDNWVKIKYNLLRFRFLKTNQQMN